jgi:hypothetical protein
VLWVSGATNEVFRCALPSCGGGPDVLADMDLAGDVIGFSGLALYDNNVYWSAGFPDGGSVFQCPTMGCGAAPTVVATGQGGPGYMAADESGVYWTNYYDGRVMRCPLSGCEEPVQVAKTRSPFAIALDSVSVYFTSSPGLFGSGTGRVLRVAK